MKAKIFPLFLAVGFLWGCQTHTSQKNSQTAGPVNKFSDDSLRTIYNLADSRDSLSLLPYLHNPNSQYRKAAATAFASIQSPTLAPRLAPLLSDTNPEVRLAAAYAIGQSRNPGMIDELLHALDRDTVSVIKAELYEAIGKIGFHSAIDSLWNHRPKNPTEETGLAWALFRAGNRGVLQESDIPLIKGLLTAKETETRVAAAYTVGRTRNVDFTSCDSLLHALAANDKSAEVRMCAIADLGKIDNKDDYDLIVKMAYQDPDPRVRVNGLRAMRNIPYDQASTALWAGISDDYPMVQREASNVLYSKLPSSAVPTALSHARALEAGYARSRLLAGVLRIDPNEKESLQILHADVRDKELNPYSRGYALAALSESTQLLPHMADILCDSIDAMSSDAAAPFIMANILKLKKGALGLLTHCLKKSITNHLPGMVAQVCYALEKLPAISFNPKDTPLLDKALKEFASDPVTYETAEELRAVMVRARLAPSVEIKRPPHRGINWSVVKNLDPHTLAEVSTSAGKFTIELCVEDAPSSVGNFVELCRDKFYNRKYFHRLVPNFVIQGGSPDGTGFGSLPYSISSELGPLHYGAGVVGLASAGKDTENCQWFITHSPAPHLDGRYSILGAVTSGMDVVLHLKVGSMIDSIQIVNRSNPNR